MVNIWKTLIENQLGDEYFYNNVHLLISVAAIELFDDEEEPNIVELNNSMKWWNLLPVYKKTSDEDFFESIRRGYFNVNMYLRNEEELNYLPLRDKWHDTFGHLPILQNEYYSNYLKTLGYLYWLSGSNKNETRIKELISRVYWVTSEFGLIGVSVKKAYGAGLVSSISELRYATSNESKTFPLDGLFVNRLMDLNIEYENFQNEYLIIQSFSDLQKIIQQIMLQFD